MRKSRLPHLIVGILLAASFLPGQAARLDILESEGRYRLELDGEPYLIKGVGMGLSLKAIGVDAFDLLVEAGGNTFRTWELDELDEQLAKAEEHGLKVLVGLDSGKQLQGFDYDDEAAVAKQFDRLSTIVQRYKSHPAVLGWIISNEPNLVIDESGALVRANPRVYDALGELVDFIHEHDPDHPVTFSLAFTPTILEDVKLALQRAPALDFVSFQAYGALPAIAPMVEEIGLDRPYMVTEFGPLGHWEMPATDWGREIEEPSAMKAAGLKQRLQGAVEGKTDRRFVGGFAFLWGHKQERTPTWYGLLTSRGHKVAAVDELSRVWTGDWPENRAPLSRSIQLEGQPATASIRLSPGQLVSATVTVVDPEDDPLTTQWHIREEVSARSDGGHFEQAPPEVPARFTSKPTEAGHDAESIQGTVSVNFDAPLAPGEYRLFAYTSDGEGGAGTANIPFLVEP